jgi:hypothetical protein
MCQLMELSGAIKVARFITVIGLWVVGAMSVIRVIRVIRVIKVIG